MSYWGSVLEMRSIVAWGCSLAVVAALGCGEERKVVDAEPVGAEQAGSAAPMRSRAGEGVESNAAGSAAEIAAAGHGAASEAHESMPEADEPEVPEEENYGWVKFIGAPFGEGKAPNEQLRRQIRVTVHSDSTMLGKGYVMRSSLKTSYVDVALAISNGNPELRCFVKAEAVLWKTASGDVISGDDHEMTYLSGSVGDSSGTPTTTCLGPGEKGYFLEIQATHEGMDSLFDSLAEVELTLAASASRFERPLYRVVPMTWHGTVDELEVKFRNLGTKPAPIELGQGQFILTDGDGSPLTWGFLDAETPLTTLGVGQTVSMKSDVYYMGKASNLLVSFGY